MSNKSPHFNRNRNIPDLIAEQRAHKPEPDTSWFKTGEEEIREIPFENSWGNVGVLAGVTNAPAGWYLSTNGEVRMRGKVDGGAVGTRIFVLPEEVRPEYAETFICAVDGGLKANVTIHANGDVIVDSIT